MPRASEAHIYYLLKLELNKMTDNKQKKLEEIANYIMGTIGDYEGTECEELHHNLFNTTFYIFGRYQAEEWLQGMVFEVIGDIIEYEKFQFGEITTDITEPENVVNMYTYILGEEILQTLKVEMEGKLTTELIAEIKEAITNEYLNQTND